MTVKRRLTVLDCSTEDEVQEEAALKLAFASNDMRVVNQHFGSAESFVIYAVDPEESKLLEVAQFSVPAGEDNEDKLSEKLELLEGCVAVYTQAVGASAVRQLKTIGVQPVKVNSGTEIADLIEALQDELRSGPGTWLARAIESQYKGPAARFDEMEMEGWEE